MRQGGPVMSVLTLDRQPDVKRAKQYHVPASLCVTGSIVSVAVWFAPFTL